MSKIKVDQTNARLSRGEEMRLGLILAALKANAPRKLVKARKGAGETRRADQPAPAVA